MELILYIAILLVPIFMIPNMYMAATLAKRVLLYILATTVCIYWIWHGFDTRLTGLDHLILVLLGYSAVSITWAINKTVAIRDVIQLGAFIVVYLLARTVDLNLVITLLASVGVLGLLISVYIKYGTELGSKCKRGAWHGPLRRSQTLWPMGNVSGASCIFMVGALASIYLLYSGKFWAIPLLVCNLFGLYACDSKAAYLGTLAGCGAYVFS